MNLFALKSNNTANMCIFKICYPCLVIFSRGNKSIMFLISRMKKLKAMFPTFYQLRIIRKKERMKGKKKEMVDFKWAHFFWQPRSTEHLLAFKGQRNVTKQIASSSLLRKCLQKKTLVFAPSSLILPLV